MSMLRRKRLLGEDPGGVRSASNCSWDANRFDANLTQERVEALGEFRQIVAWDLRIEVVLEVVCQLEKERGDDPASKGVCLGEQGLAIAAVRQVDGQKRVGPAPQNHKTREDKRCRSQLEEKDGADDETYCKG